MKDILVLLATGFEDTELVSTINIFDREGLSFDLLSIENKKQVKGQSFAFVETMTFDEVKTDNYKGIFIPGGAGHELILQNNQALQIVKDFGSKDKLVSAICAGPEVLLKVGVVDGETKITSYPGFAKNGFNTGEEVEVWKNIVTGRDFLATIPFAQAVVKYIKNMA